PAGALPRPQVAAFNAGTGALLDWLPPPNQGGEFFSHTGQERSSGNGIVFDIVLSGDGSKLYAAGTFVDFGGQSGLVSLDAATGQPTDWQAGLDRPVFALEVWRGDGHTLFAATGGAGGMLYAFKPGARKDVRWSVKADGDNVDVVATASKVYLMGHYDFIIDAKAGCSQRCPRGDPRRHLAAFDAVSGDIDANWHPVANTNTGPYTAVIGARHLWIGGEFTNINRQPQPGVVQFPALQ
ncbi:MAG: PQQ-like beta-propeller repeat protein, partial [Actinomycetota bacterium]|nr:PQQ-like beta-propeller repeat protein [Actinomycetota bacterium]